MWHSAQRGSSAAAQRQLAMASLDCDHFKVLEDPGGAEAEVGERGDAQAAVVAAPIPLPMTSPTNSVLSPIDGGA
ncbi:hypothetical protein AQI70_10955 [Streptomyces curacoi]|uniref:Uncharacterized protein n=2 Tax=Streptomyces curacoi TaxID=146536 RepID=A0A124H481_9ACTN|nr:hypothetical protein AQI70_10955 [Streptomyces curacoi]